MRRGGALAAALAAVALVAPVARGAGGLPAVDPGAVERFAAALRFPTISHQDAAQLERGAFQGLHAQLRRSFPLLHERLEREEVGEHGVLYTWRGSDPDLAPALLLAHLDVVPVEAGTEAAWTQPPFGGVVADGFVWGRGALDDKASALAMLEAIETLLRAGVQPRRTVLVALGHDEEVGGRHGAMRIAALLRKRGVAPEYVLDEGGVVTHGIVPDVPVPVATVGIAEKGYLTVELAVDGPGGHSSVPPPETTVGILATAIARLETHKMPARMTVPTRLFLKAVAPAMPFTSRIALNNMWLFGPLVERRMVGSAAAAASVRTTTAPTMLEGSVKENVLPTHARGVVNFRILPGDSVRSVLEHVHRTIDDPRVHVRALPGMADEPSPVSPVDAPPYRMLARRIHDVFGADVVVAPCLVLGATDARHYAGLSPNVYRFIPIGMGPDDVSRYHGTNERLPVAGYERAVAFYVALLGGDAGDSQPSAPATRPTAPAR